MGVGVVVHQLIKFERLAGCLGYILQNLLRRVVAVQIAFGSSFFFLPLIRTKEKLASHILVVSHEFYSLVEAVDGLVHRVDT